MSTAPARTRTDRPVNRARRTAQPSDPAEPRGSASGSAVLGAARTPAPPKPSRLARARARAKRALSLLSVVAALGASLVGGRYAHKWLVSTARFGARDIAVSGLRHAGRDEVLVAARIFVGRNVLSIDGERAARAIEGLPWVARARVERRLPGTVRIAVEERSPAAILSASGLYLVAEDGSVFKRVAAGDPTDLPVITGVSRAMFELDPQGARAAMLDALALLADVGASAVGPSVHVDEVHRAATGDLAMMVDGTYVWLGRGPYRAKLTRLRAVLQELRRRGLRAAEVHLEGDRHPERVTVRPVTARAPQT